MKKAIIILIVLAVISLILLWIFGYFTKNAPAYDSIKVGTCDVCKYAKGDTAHRPTQYCSMCDANICEQCFPDIPLRALAMANKKLNIISYKPVNQ